MESRGTTEIGEMNGSHQEVIRDNGLPGTDHWQRVYVVLCNDCGAEYGANGSDIHERCCPRHDGGAPGLPIR